MLDHLNVQHALRVQRALVSGCRSCGGDAARASVGASAQWAGNCARPAKPPYVWTEDDYDALRRGASALRVRPEDLLLVMELESGRNPHQANCNGSGYPTANGLNQITSDNSNAMKISEAERLSLLEMSAAEQMPYVVRSFLAARHGVPFSTPPDAVTLYQTNIAPGTVPNEVVYRQKVFPCPDPKFAHDAYCANRGLDKNGDGVITRADLAQVLRGVATHEGYRKAIKELHGEMPVIGGSSISSSDEGFGFGALVASVLGAFGARYLWQTYQGT
jgi:hypothetical protein